MTEQQQDNAKPAEIDPLDVIDLDQERSRRAAAREGKRKSIPIRFGGEEIAVLPIELPLDVLSPLRDLDSDVTLVVRQVVSAYKARAAKEEQTAQDAIDMVVDVLAANPRLPVSVLDTIVAVAKNLLTEDGFAALVAQRPSTDDYAALAKGVLRAYGVTLGEALPPSGSPSSGGETSNTTSESTSDSTSAISGPTETTPVSSASGVS